ncbi:RecX family transcriptional regulator [Candidatus Saccharibacteria bacterium]|nr:RecX family transcriptional regulator [Candidatus Saccharibacteria bacterium]
MKITAIKSQKRDEERVSVFVDGKYSFSLTISQLLENKVKQGQEIDEGELTFFRKLSNEGKIRFRAMAWVMSRPRSVKELRDYLKKTSFREKIKGQNFGEDFIANLIEDFIARGWVSDQYFAEWWIGRSSRQNSSRLQIINELRSKGIEKSIIDEVLKSRNEADSLRNLVERLKNKSKYQDQMKLKRYLASKGYGYSSIEEVLAEGNEENAG